MIAKKRFLVTASTTAIQEIMSLVADVIAERPMPTGYEMKLFLKKMKKLGLYSKTAGIEG